MTTEQLAERWQVSTRNVRDMAAAGEIPAMKLGKLWRFPTERVARFEKSAVSA
ncbi:helix-turn-helix domain-containing protein [Gordonia sp. i37]|uniref:helix-turn-helix domain-containing protein n=1 Tax=Gordonia sp. i37 TaxID=1961707 RepID=UPI001553DD68|nr:helix-turn-helix domain-containing protein [Gordonia sp. i37]